MTYKKETCKLCTGNGCDKCNENGFQMIAERPHLTKKHGYSNKPLGTGARDGFNYGINK